MSFEIVLKNDSSVKFLHQPTVLEVSQKISSSLAKDTLGGIINTKNLVDLRTALESGDKIEIVTKKHPLGLEVIRHSAAHVLAQAVQELWPEVKVTIGPVVESGYYYDFDSTKVFSSEDLLVIEKRMKQIIKKNFKVEKIDWPIDQAIDYFKEKKEIYKVEIIEGLKDEGLKTVSVYKQGDWLDLCRGPHVQQLSQIPVVKLMSVAGAYWKGDETKAQLQRIYGTAFFSQKDLDEYVQNIAEAKKRDHRLLGKQLDLFFLHESSPGAPFFTAKGSVIYNALIDFIRSLYREHGYNEVITPQIFDVELYHQSGHYDHYRENMYFSKTDSREFSVKPMNCPAHCLMYSQKKHSYRELPLRIADFGRLHRYERSGTMHGLTRVRSMCQDDAHVFCTMSQLSDEISNFMKLVNTVYKALGMSEYQIFLSTRPEKKMGSDSLWDEAEEALKVGLDSCQLEYQLNEGDGAFYGPKVDIMFIDALKRPWQLGTLQCDFNMPQAFDLKYVGEDDKPHTPVMLHRAILGSIERFLGVYLEHTAGKLPLWLSPVQVIILPVSERHNLFSQKLYKELLPSLRVKLDDRNEKLGFKIREAQMSKIPYMIVVGDKEQESGCLSVRTRKGENTSEVPVKEFINSLEQENKRRRFVAE